MLFGDDEINEWLNKAKAYKAKQKEGIANVLKKDSKGKGEKLEDKEAGLQIDGGGGVGNKIHNPFKPVAAKPIKVAPSSPKMTGKPPEGGFGPHRGLGGGGAASKPGKKVGVI